MIFDEAIRYAHGSSSPLLGTQRHNLNQHVSSFGWPSLLSDSRLIEAISEVQLTGRGGGHFPVRLKLDSLSNTGAELVVVNAAEGEPLARKDAALLQTRPHLVLDGAQALARLLGAREVVVWIHAGADASSFSILTACEERAMDANYRHEVPIRLLAGPARYLTGEGSAVISGVRGAEVLPRFISNPARPWVDGEPVVVHNAETHARIGQLHNCGSDAYQTTSLVTLRSAEYLNVVEVHASTTFAELFQRNSIPESTFVLLGGYGGTWVRWEDIRDLGADPAILKAHGFSFGAGIVRPLLPNESGLHITADILSYMAGESAGQCGPCVFGLPTLAQVFGKIAKKSSISKRTHSKLEELFVDVAGRGACRHPDGTVRLARSALHSFANSGAA